MHCKHHFQENNLKNNGGNGNNICTMLKISTHSRCSKNDSLDGGVYHCSILTRILVWRPARFRRLTYLSVGATRLSLSFAKGAEATGRAIHKGGARIRDRITPEETASEVNPRVTKGLNATKQATGGAVRVTQLLGENISLNLFFY